MLLKNMESITEKVNKILEDRELPSISDYLREKGIIKAPQNVTIEQINNAIDEGMYFKALDLMSFYHGPESTTDKRMDIYEKLLEKNKVSPRYSGKLTEENGLFEKAIRFYRNAQKPQIKEAERLEKRLKKSEFELSLDNAYISTYDFDDPEQKDNLELVYEIKNGNKQKIEDLKRAPDEGLFDWQVQEELESKN